MKTIFKIGLLFCLFNCCVLARQEIDTIENIIDTNTIIKQKPITYYDFSNRKGSVLLFNDCINYKSIPTNHYFFTTELITQNIPTNPLFTTIAGNHSAFSIFGSLPSENTCLLNGVSMNDFYGSANFDFISPEIANNIEILYGSSAAIKTGKSGLAINIQPFIYNVNKPYSKIWYAQGDNKLIGVDGIYSQNFMPNWNFMGGFKRTSSNSYYHNSFVDMWNARLMLSFQQSKQSAFSLLYHFTNFYTGDFGGILFNDYNKNYSSAKQVRSNFNTLTDRQYKTDIILAHSYSSGEKLTKTRDNTTDDYNNARHSEFISESSDINDHPANYYAIGTPPREGNTNNEEFPSRGGVAVALATDGVVKNEEIPKQIRNDTDFERNKFVINTNLFFNRLENNIFYGKDTSLTNIFGNETEINIANCYNFGANSNLKYNFSDLFSINAGAELNYSNMPHTPLMKHFKGLGYNVFAMGVLDFYPHCEHSCHCERSVAIQKETTQIATPINRLAMTDIHCHCEHSKNAWQSIISFGGRIGQKYDKDVFSFGGNITQSITEKLSLIADISYLKTEPIPVLDYHQEKHLLTILGFNYSSIVSFNLFYRCIKDQAVLTDKSNLLQYNIADNKLFGGNVKTNISLPYNFNAAIISSGYTDIKNYDFYNAISLEYTYTKNYSSIIFGLSGALLLSKNKYYFSPLIKNYVRTDLNEGLELDGLMGYVKAKLGNCYLRISFRNPFGLTYSYLAYYPMLKQEFNLSLTWAFP